LSIAPLAFDNPSEAPTIGCQFLISHQYQRDNGMERVAAAAFVSMVLGLARSLDKVFMAQLTGAVPTGQAFSLAAAAAAGLRFDELRAIIGTAGTGAGVDAMGKLRANGIEAELTGDTANSFIGSFQRAALCLHEDIRLFVERRDANGSLLITCLANAQPLIADPLKFWRTTA
jgi:hypothetical protein